MTKTKTITIPEATITVTLDDVGPCPFCGRSLQVDIEMCAVLHGVPPCPEFNQAHDSLAFMTMCRKKREQSAT